LILLAFAGDALYRDYEALHEAGTDEDADNSTSLRRYSTNHPEENPYVSGRRTPRRRWNEME